MIFSYRFVPQLPQLKLPSLEHCTEPQLQGCVTTKWLTESFSFV